MKSYIVTAMPKNPAYNDRGHEMEIDAESKAAAISEARSRVRRDCIYDRHDGPIEYSAIEAGRA